MNHAEVRSTPRAARIPLLAQMREDLREHGSLQPTTVVAMYATYGVHAAATLAAVRGRWLPLPAPSRAAGAAGAVMTSAGAALCLLGMRAFVGPGQVSGTSTGPLVTGGVYRLSRNPQYLGYVLVLAGTSLAARSGAGIALAGAAAATFSAWIPAEEQHLEGIMGEPYQRYRRSTARWLRWPGHRAL
jgi:protein-S-isoprenylcysteine O-methyltransferase Ste14